MVLSESSCPGDSEYVSQRGAGVFKAELRTAEVDPHFGTNILKIVAVLVFSDTSYFC